MEIPYIKPILAIIKQCVNSEDLAGKLGNSIKPSPCPDHFFMQSTFVLFSRRPLMNRPAVNLVQLRETQNESVLHKEMI